MTEERFILITWIFIAIGAINLIVWWILPGEHTIATMACLGLIIIVYMIMMSYLYPIEKGE